MAFYDKWFDHSAFSAPYVGKDAFSYFAEGYRRAADTLAKSLLRRRGFSNWEAYPVVFLYRHAFELSLKHAIYKAAEYAGYCDTSNFDDRLHNTHNVRRLAEIVSDSVMKLLPDDLSSQQLCSRITSTACELDLIDASSFVFRYPINVKGEPAGKTKELVNLRLFAHHMASLLEEIDTLNFCLDNLTDTAQDAFTEWFRENLDYSL